MDPLVDPRCLVTAEALLVDGANGVCGAPRHHAGEAPPLPASSLFVVVFVVALAVRLRRPLMARPGALLAGALVVGALPGLIAVVAVRADRPFAVGATADRVVHVHDEVTAFARAHGGAFLRTEAELAVVPIARLALARMPENRDAPIDLFEGSLDEGCEEIDGALTCGTPPASSAP